MRKVIVDFIAYKSVVVELHDNDDDDIAIQKAERFLSHGFHPIQWEYDNVEETDNEPDVKLED